MATYSVQAALRSETHLLTVDSTRTLVVQPIGHELPRSNQVASLLTLETALGWVFDSEG